jgi:hypothetical protein
MPNPVIMLNDVYAVYQNKAQNALCHFAEWHYAECSCVHFIAMLLCCLWNLEYSYAEY